MSHLSTAVSAKLRHQLVDILWRAGQPQLLERTLLACRQSCHAHDENASTCKALRLVLRREPTQCTDLQFLGIQRAIVVCVQLRKQLPARGTMLPPLGFDLIAWPSAAVAPQ